MFVFVKGLHHFRRIVLDEFNYSYQILSTLCNDSWRRVPPDWHKTGYIRPSMEAWEQFIPKSHKRQESLPEIFFFFFLASNFSNYDNAIEENERSVKLGKSFEKKF